jgi:hypothetical protein
MVDVSMDLKDDQRLKTYLLASMSNNSAEVMPDLDCQFE